MDGGQSNKVSVTLYDDGTGIDAGSSQPLNPANPTGNNAAAFNLLEGPTDLRFCASAGTRCESGGRTAAIGRLWRVQLRLRTDGPAGNGSNACADRILTGHP